MNAVERAGYLARARGQAYARQIDVARALIVQALAEHDSWAIAFSGGKDSTVVLDLVLGIQHDLPVCWIDDGWDYPETLQFLRETESRIGRSILRIYSPVTSPFWKDHPYGGDDPAVEHPVDMHLDDWCERYNTFLGVRAKESGARRIHLRSHSPLYYSGEWKHWCCCPIAAWSMEDVWAHIAFRNLPYNPVYDRLSELGVLPKYQRVGPLTAWMVWQYGTLSWARQGWPDLWNRFVKAFPYAERYT